MAEMVHTLANSGGDYTSIAQWITDTSVVLTSTNIKVYGGTLTGAIPTGSAVTGDTSGATGTVIGPAASGQILVDDGGGTTFISGEEIELDSDPTNQYFTTSDGGDETTVAVLECDKTGYGSGKNETDLNVTGATCNATNYREIRPQSGSEHDGTSVTSGFYLVGPPTDYLLRISESNSRVSQIGGDIKSTGGGTMGGFSTNSSAGGADKSFFQGCIADDTGSGSGQIDGFIGSAYTYLTAKACMALNCTNGFYRLGSNSRDIELTNCIAKDCTTGFHVDAADYDWRNCIAYGGTTRYDVGTGSDLGSTTNGADDVASNTPPGTSPITTNLASGDFDGAASDDMRPLDSGTAHAAGSNQSARAPTDIVGDSFPGDTNIGAFANSSAAAGDLPLVLYTSPGLSVTNP